MFFLWLVLNFKLGVKGLKLESFVNPRSFVFYILEAFVCKKPTKSRVCLFLCLSLSVNKTK